VTTLVAPSPATDGTSARETLIVAMGRMGVARGSQLLTTVGLGSCIAIVLFAPRQRLVALAHCMLPTRNEGDGAFAKFVDSAVPALVTLLQSEGASGPFAAALVGGASMFPGVSSALVSDIAGGNVHAARSALAAASIPLRMEEVGGHVGRSVTVDPSAQRVMVRTIRDGERWL
jgi:chemotaxis protein CheD